MKEYEMKVGDEYSDEENVTCTSLVDNPATQKLFAVFSSEDEGDTKPSKHKFQVLPTPTNKQLIAQSPAKFERIISGVWFMPDTDYPKKKVDENGEEKIITVSMDKDQLMTALKNFMQSGASNNFDVMHDGKQVQGLRTIETWMLYDYGQLSPVLLNSIWELGYEAEDIPIGTVFMSVFIEDEAFFNDMILTGKVKGFSIEGVFDILEKPNTTDTMKAEEMFNALGLSQSEGTLITTEGNLSIKEEILFNDEKVIDGSYMLANDFKLEVREGKLVDFGFAEVVVAEVAPVVAEVAVVESVEEVAPAVDIIPEVAVVEDIIEAKGDIGVGAEDKDASLETKQPLSDVNGVVELDAKLAERDAEITQLKEALAAESAAKEEALKSLPIHKTSIAPSYDLKLYREVLIAGSKHYVPKL